MKVLYFHQHFSTPKGSVGIRSYQLARRLISEGHSVTMVCGSYGGGETGLTTEFQNGRRRGSIDGIDVIEFDLSYSNAHGFLRRTLTFLRFSLRSTWVALKEPCDLVFATTTPLTAGIPGIAARWLRRKPFVFEVRDLWPELPRAMNVIKNPLVYRLLALLEWASYKSATRLVGLSPGIVEGIRKLDISSASIRMIPNGCDIDIFSSPAEGWRPPGIQADDFLAVFAGTHGIANGLDAVLDAAKVLKDRNALHIKILLIGDGKLKPALLERARSEQLTNVVFHDPISKSSLARLLKSTDLGLQVLANIPAFYYGTSPNKFFDYIAAGVPVLNNYPGWLAQMIQQHDCGYVVPPEQPRAFAEALITAAEDASLTGKGLNARGLANDFERNLMASQFVEWLEGAYEEDF
ncbi:glycosyltransferase family 4 protein [Pseudomonas sp. KNUC1026]|uniref:glycosyltransferase family 4 protein n=1 Tax=Pseudomonas sp. KNUC1026 TaxID=2893890 RepID=UPI001F1EC892|nr:glycosyltransferase family 4 protein [Pseudomonas sp. KNUC1026]UFH48243.1 glycosyltransferase family 4 protein [Pseudomonas sp. KNUC1026]